MIGQNSSSEPLFWGVLRKFFYGRVSIHKNSKSTSDVKIAYKFLMLELDIRICDNSCGLAVKIQDKPEQNILAKPNQNLTVKLRKSSKIAKKDRIL